MPLFQLLVYLVIDRRMNYDPCLKYTDTPMWNAKLLVKMWQGYVQDENAPDIAYASPMEAQSFEKLPSAYVETAEFDCLHDEGIAYLCRGTSQSRCVGGTERNERHDARIRYCGKGGNNKKGCCGTNFVYKRPILSKARVKICLPIHTYQKENSDWLRKPSRRYRTRGSDCQGHACEYLLERFAHQTRQPAESGRGDHGRSRDGRHRGRSRLGGHARKAPLMAVKQSTFACHLLIRG